MLTVIFALFPIFPSLRVSSSTADAQGRIPLLSTSISSVGCRVGPLEPVPVLDSAASVRGFSWRLARYEKSKGTATNNGNSNNKRKGMENEEDPYPITINSSPTLLLPWKTLRSQNWASKSSCRSINSARWSEKIVRLITWSFWMLVVRYDTPNPK